MNPPRNDLGVEHFQWQDVRLEGLSAVGRTTINVLRINHADSVKVREALSRENAFVSSATAVHEPSAVYG